MVFTDDCVELFLMPPNDEYYHIVINRNGVVYDAKVNDKSWDGAYEISTAANGQHWSVDCKIAWSSFKEKPQKGQRWKVNFARERFAGKEEVSTAYMILSGFHEKSRFWPLLFE